MAVYKSTRCYPFLNSLDIRVAQIPGSTEKPVQYLKCKVDTSNKKITGYKIRILDSTNNVIFDPDYISPITELQTGDMAALYNKNGDNSGLNGTYLYVPFFQSDALKKTNSLNSLYYTPQYSVDHIVMNQGLCDDYNPSITIDEANNIEYKVDDVYMWTKDSGSTDVRYDTGEAIVVLDGEVVQEGDVVLFATSGGTLSGFDDTDLGFYKVTREEVGRTWYTVFKKMDVTIGNGAIINVTKGKTFHNTNWKKKVDGYYENYDSSNLYKRYTPSGDPVFVSGLDLGGTLYKWEITLYQGEGVPVPSSGTYQYVDYSSLDNTDYDMVTSSGTILGSNSSRIQIANIEPFDSQGLVNDEAVLPGLKEGVLVLQGKRMSFGNFSGNGSIFASTRHYVQSYDSSYGHAYPIEGDVSIEEINNNNAVQFFKYSNNPDEIKEQDIVSYGIGYNIAFRLYSYDDDTFTTVNSLTDFASVLINDRRYGISKNDLPSYAQNLINSGDKIIFTGQSSGATTAPYQNGIYEVYTLDNVQVTDILFLKRAASYKSWGDYLGKIVFCRYYIESSSGGAASSINLESLAAPSSNYSLWDPDEVDPASGSSELYFTQEMPILLFENTFETSEVETFDLRGEGISIDVDDPLEHPYPITGPIDGITVAEGMTVLIDPWPSSSTEMKVMKAEMLNNALYLVYQQKTVSTANEYYIIQGKKFGKRIFSGTDDTPRWEYHTAVLLKNTCYQTYISPFINVNPQMKLKLLQGKKANTVDGATSWIPIQNVHPFLYCIFHKKNNVGYLNQPFNSEKNSETNTPWKYEIRSFFKASDENPFYCYEMPYLVLYKNNVEYSSLLREQDQEYWVTENSNETYPFKVIKDLTDYQNFVFNSFKDPKSIYGRSVKFSADYVQFDGLSWESYRWSLYNEDGELLQDTGRKYDKTIAVIFYGLSNDKTTETGSSSIYYAVLEVEDEKQNKVIYVIKFKVEPATPVGSNLDFKATLECDIHAVKLDFSQFRYLKPSFREGEEDNSIVDVYGSNGGVGFYQNIGAKIYNKTEAPVDYSNGSNIAASDGDHDELTMAGSYGMPYYTTFNSSEIDHSTTNESGLFIETQSEDVDPGDNGQFYFETSVCLDANFSGSVVSWSVEGEQNDSTHAFPYLESDGDEFSKTGFVNFELKTADNFLFVSDTDENYTLNPDRNKFVFKVSVSNTTKEHLCGLTFFNISDIGNNSYYYLQPESEVSNSIKNKNYEYLEYDLSYYPGDVLANKNELYVKKDKDGNYFSGGSYFLTNLCMTESLSDTTFPYWDETRPYLNKASVPVDTKILNNEALQYTDGVRKSATHVDTSDNVQLWPSSSTEDELYWVEPVDIVNYPILWTDVLATDSHVVKMVALKRHYGIENYNYHLICRIDNIKGLFNGISNLSFSEASLQGDSEGTVLTLLIGGVSIGTVTIIKESD